MRAADNGGTLGGQEGSEASLLRYPVITWYYRREFVSADVRPFVKPIEESLEADEPEYGDGDGDEEVAEDGIRTGVIINNVEQLIIEINLGDLV